MQNKSEMINRIAELAEENAELKAKIKKYAELNEIDTRDYAALHNENIKLNAIIDSYQPRLQALKVEIAELKAYKDVNEDFKTAWEELKAENERLNRCLLEALHHEGEKLRETIKYKQTLQEIKEIAERCNLCEECSGLDDCERECGDNVEPCSTYQMQIIVNKITKAEEE